MEPCFSGSRRLLIGLLVARESDRFWAEDYGGNGFDTNQNKA